MKGDYDNKNLWLIFLIVSAGYGIVLVYIVEVQWFIFLITFSCSVKVNEAWELRPTERAEGGRWLHFQK